jgi:outer membrane receptor protein involved in Fe transport
MAGRIEGQVRQSPRAAEKAKSKSKSSAKPIAKPGGVIQGVVTQTEPGGEPVEGAGVSVIGTDLKAQSGANGAFELKDVPVGERAIRVTKEGFDSASAQVVVKEGETSEVPVLLFAQEKTPTMIITARIRPKSTAAVIEQKRTDVGTSSRIGKKEISTTGVSTAVGVAKQLPSVTAVDNKFIYVRGLGDRYSQTLLNGSSIPSPEPDKRVIPLDLFPANLLESIAISKTYSPDLPGEFSGGSVQIRTVDVPDQDFLNLGVDVKYRYRTTFHDFNTYHGGNLDHFSFDDGTRQLPGEVPPDSLLEGVKGLTAEDIQEISRSFTNIWNVETITAPLDHKASLSFGKTIGQKGDSSLGIVGALNWANRYQNILNEKRRFIANTGTPDHPVTETISDFKLDSSIFEAELSALLSLTYEINPGQKVGVRSLYTRSAEDQVRLQTGFDSSYPEPVDVTLLRWVQRSLFTIQPYGEHLLVGDTLLEWRAGYALSQRDEPDNRQVRYLVDPKTGIKTFQFGEGSGRRDFYLLDENIYDVNVDCSIPINPFGVQDKNLDPDKKNPDQKIKVGPAFLFRDRHLDTRKFLITSEGGSIPVDDAGQPIDFASDPENIFKSPNLNPHGLFYEERTKPTDNYTAEQTIFAGYGLADFRVFEDLRLQIGARVESSRQEVKTFPLFGQTNESINTRLETTDILPAANITWEFWKEKVDTKDASNGARNGTHGSPDGKPNGNAPKKEPQSMLLRLAGSQTVSRPEFRELAPFDYQDVLGGYVARGNPNLERAKIANLDLGWEWYLSPSEVISAGLFYKKFKDPIEVVSVPLSSSLLTTWENAESADLYGFEVEARKSLDIIAKDLKDISVIANFAYMKSEVKISADASAIQTNDKRPLQGQPEYVLNVGFLYDSKESGLTVSLLANRFGERISAVGQSGIDDEKELPRWALDLSINKRLGPSTLKLTVENILNDKYAFKQQGVFTREYRRGFAVGIGYSYSF